MKRLWNLRWNICFSAGAMLLYIMYGSSAVYGRGRVRNHLAPNFSRETLDARKITLSSFRGKVVLLNFWASWCDPCRVELPSFVDWQRRYGAQGLQIFGVSMDDEEKDALAADRSFGLNYPVVMGDARLGELYGGILGLPVTFLIDKSGTIRFRHQGATDLNVINSEIRTLLLTH